MNRIEKGIAAAGIFFAALAAGCGTQETTPESILRKGEKAQEEAEAESVTWKISAGVSVESAEIENMSFDLAANVSGKTDIDRKNPGLSRTDADLDTVLSDSEMTQSLKIYTEKADDTRLNVYLGEQDGSWTSASADAAVLQEGSVSSFSQIADAFSVEENTEDTEDTDSCWKLTADLTGQQITDSMPYFAAALKTMQAESSQLDTGTFHVTLYAAKDTGLPVRITAEMDEEGNSAEETADSAAEAESGTESVAASGAETDSSAEVESGTESIAASGAETDSSAEAESTAADDTAGGMIFNYYQYSFSMDFTWSEIEAISVPDDVKKEAAAGEVSMESILRDCLGSTVSGGSEDEGFDNPNEGSQFESVRGATVIRDFSGVKDDSDVICDEKGVQVKLEKVYTDGYDTVYIDVAVSNSSDAAVEIYSNGIALNRIMTGGSLYAGVGAGEQTETTVEIDDLESQHLSSEAIGTLQIDLMASDSRTYDTILDTGVKEVTLDKDVQQPEDTEGTEIYKDDNVRVLAYPEADKDASLVVPVCVISLQDQQSVSISAEEVQKKSMEIDGTLIVDCLFPGCRAYTSLTVESSEADDLGLDNLSGVSFRLMAQNNSDYSEAFTTDSMTIPEMEEETAQTD